MTDNIKCKWCEKSFRSERTLAAHACPKKRRWSDRDMTHTRLGFRVFQLFYELNTASTKPKTQEDFIRSQYYEGFTKFGRSCILNEYLAPEKFAEWLIRKSVKLADWSKDITYNEWLRDYVRKETGLRALERTVIYFSEWGTDHETSWNQYFREVTANRAVHDIRSAKVSPWALYLSQSGEQLLTRFSTEQVQLINDIIDPPFWMKLFQNNIAEVDAVRETCHAAGL